MKTKIEKFLAHFSKDATSWAQATDEVRDLARTSREYLADYDGVIVEPMDCGDKFIAFVEDLLLLLDCILTFIFSLIAGISLSLIPPKNFIASSSV